MSFLSRKPTRPGDRGGDAGRGDEYDDYDLYTPDGYQSKDDGGSLGEYFSPEGIKGRWAGENPDGRAGGRGRREDGPPGEPSRGAPSSPADRSSGYGADEYATGAYELPEGSDGDRPERGRRRRRDREDRTDSWTTILRLRRDRGEDIWPDDGVSDEDYWASVASDQPLNGSGTPAGSDRPAAAGESRFGGDQRGPDQRETGRLGPPPGLAGDYQPGAGSAPGRATGRPATGPHALRANTGPGPTVGVTVSRPPAGPGGPPPGTGGNRGSGPNAGWPGGAPPRRSTGSGPGSGGFPQQPAARPSFQPNTPQTAGPPAGTRQPDPGGWGDRTERIERVNASGYPDPPASGRSQSPGSPAGSDRREPDRRDSDRDTGGIWSIPARDPGPARNGEDDPLTSAAYSRKKLGETDGRSYRTAARRSQAQTQLSDQTESFFVAQYPGGQYQAGHTGAFDYPGTRPAEQRTTEFRPDRGDTPAAAAPPPGGRYPAVYGDQPKYPPPPGRGQSGPRPQAAGQPSGPPGPGQQAPGQQAPGQQAPGQGNGPAPAAQPGRGPGADRRPGTPGGGQPSGQYESQHARPPQPPRPQAQPAAGPLGAPVHSGSSAPAGGGSSGAAPSNPYDSAATGSYPYPGQPYPARPAPAGSASGEQAPGGPAGPGRDAADSRYYWPAPPPGAPSHRAAQDRAAQDRDDQGRAGYGNSQPAPRDRPY